MTLTSYSTLIMVLYLKRFCTFLISLWIMELTLNMKYKASKLTHISRRNSRQFNLLMLASAL